MTHFLKTFNVETNTICIFLFFSFQTTWFTSSYLFLNLVRVPDIGGNIANTLIRAYIHSLRWDQRKKKIKKIKPSFNVPLILVISLKLPLIIFYYTIKT